MIKTQPKDLEAEKSVLGAMLMDKSVAEKALFELSDTDFYAEKHRTIFGAIVDLFTAGGEIDTLTIVNNLKKLGELKSCGGAYYITGLSKEIPSVALVDNHIKIVKEKATLRNFIDNITPLVDSAYQETTNAEALISDAEESIFSISKKRIGTEFQSFGDILPEVFKNLDESHKENRAVGGIPTGYMDLDEKLTGLHNGELIILAGRPSMGKTALATNISINTSKNGVPVAIFSLESARAELAQRILLGEAKVNAHLARSGKLSKADFEKISNVVGDIYSLPVFIDDSPGLTVPEIRSKARKIVSKKDVKLIILDYLNLIRTKKRYDNRESEVRDISQSMKNMARELGLPVILISQLSRRPEQRKGNRPQLSDLRESGAIEQDADVVLLIYREEYYDKESPKKGQGEIIIAKQRNGPVGVIPIIWLDYCTRFENYTPKI